MIVKKKKSNIFLFLVTILSIAFYAYFISQNKGSIKIEKTKKSINNKLNNINKGFTTFKDVEYKITDVKNTSYITKGKEAIINKDNSNLIELKTVHSFTNSKNGTIINVTSKKADYYKNTKNIKYYHNVVITSKDIVVTADIANYFSKKNLIRLENNVVMKDQQNNIKGDIAELNTLTNNLEIFMINKKDQVYGKREQITN